MTPAPEAGARRITGVTRALRRTRRRVVLWPLLALTVLAWGLVVWQTLLPPVSVPVPVLDNLVDMVRCDGGVLRTRLPAAEAPIEAFYIDRFEVTRGDYATFLRVSGHPPGFLGAQGLTLPPGTEELPVSMVSLEDARAYAEWMGKRLPTPDEWEWAARGPLNTAWPWGGGPQTLVANTAEFGLGRPTPVGLFEGGRSAFGAYDLVGNVAEWTEGAAPLTLEIDERYFARGGAFDDRFYDPVSGLSLMEAYRAEDGRVLPRRELLYTRAAVDRAVGFRCVLDARAVDDALEVERLLGRLGARDPAGWYFDVRPALAALREIGIRSESLRRRLDAPGLGAAERRAIARQVGYPVLDIVHYAETNVANGWVRSRLRRLREEIERGAGTAAP